MESELRLFLDHVAGWYDQMPFAQQTRFRLPGIIGEIQRELDAAAASSDVEDARLALLQLALSQGPRFDAQDVIRFLLALNGRQVVSQDLMTRLFEEVLD